MKQDRSVEMVRLAANLELILRNDEEKIIAVTSDTAKVDVPSGVAEMATIFAMKGKVAILSYEEIETHVEGVDYIVVNGFGDTADDIKAKVAPYDIAFVVCPNMLTSKSYLHMAEYVRELVIVAKKWKSKTPNINTIKTLALESKMNVLGIVYTK